MKTEAKEVKTVIANNKIIKVKPVHDLAAEEKSALQLDA